MPGAGHKMGGKQQQPLIKIPHRSDKKSIMLGLQVIHYPLLPLHCNIRTHQG